MEHETEGARIRKKTNAEATRAQLMLAGLKPGMHALDVGCASGAATLEMARLADPATVVGLDGSAARLQEAMDLACSVGIRNVCFQRGNAMDLPFDSATFDFVWSRFLMEYLPDPLAAIREMRRTAKPGGLVAVADLDGNCLFHYPIEPNLEQGIEKVMRLPALKGFDPFVGRKLYHFFRRAGFSTITAHVQAHHVIAGIPTEGDRENWREKISTIRRALAGEAVDSDELDRLTDAFMKLIESPDTFTYSPLITVVGTR